MDYCVNKVGGFVTNRDVFGALITLTFKGSGRY